VSGYIAVALPDLAFVAADTRVTLPGHRHRDGYGKLADFAGGVSGS
jgi:hypothetical protein